MLVPRTRSPLNSSSWFLHCTIRVTGPNISSVNVSLCFTNVSISVDKIVAPTLGDCALNLYSQLTPFTFKNEVIPVWNERVIPSVSNLAGATFVTASFSDFMNSVLSPTVNTSPGFVQNYSLLIHYHFSTRTCPPDKVKESQNPCAISFALTFIASGKITIGFY